MGQLGNRLANRRIGLGAANSGGSRPRIRDDPVRHSDLSCVASHAAARAWLQTLAGDKTWFNRLMSGDAAAREEYERLRQDNGIARRRDHG